MLSWEPSATRGPSVTRRFSIWLLLAFGPVACADLTAPAAYPGTYQVVSANGAPLPTTVVAGACNATVASGWLELSPDAFSILLVMTHRCTTLRDGDTVTSWTDAVLQVGGRVTVVGTEIMLVSQAAPPAVLLAPLHLRAIPDSNGLELIWLDGLYGLPAGTHLRLTSAPLPWVAPAAPSPPH